MLRGWGARGGAAGASGAAGRRPACEAHAGPGWSCPGGCAEAERERRGGRLQGVESPSLAAHRPPHEARVHQRVVLVHRHELGVNLLSVVHRCRGRPASARGSCVRRSLTISKPPDTRKVRSHECGGAGVRSWKEGRNFFRKSLLIKGNPDSCEGRNAAGQRPLLRCEQCTRPGAALHAFARRRRATPLPHGRSLAPARTADVRRTRPSRPRCGGRGQQAPVRAAGRGPLHERRGAWPPPPPVSHSCLAAGAVWIRSSDSRTERECAHATRVFALSPKRQDLKKAYKRAAVRNHPDKGGDPEKARRGRRQWGACPAAASGDFHVLPRSRWPPAPRPHLRAHRALACDARPPALTRLNPVSLPALSLALSARSLFVAASP